MNLMNGSYALLRSSLACQPVFPGRQARYAAPLRSATVYGAGIAAGLLPLVCAAAAAEAAPGMNAEPMDAGSILRITLGLVVVVAAIFATAWGLRRWGHFRSSPRGELQVIGGLSMGPRERLVLVRVGQEQVLLGVAPGRIQTLHVLQQPIAVDPDEPGRDGGFAARMQAALKQRAST